MQNNLILLYFKKPNDEEKDNNEIELNNIQLTEEAIFLKVISKFKLRSLSIKNKRKTVDIFSILYQPKIHNYLKCFKYMQYTSFSIIPVLLMCGLCRNLEKIHIGYWDEHEVEDFANQLSLTKKKLRNWCFSIKKLTIKYEEFDTDGEDL